MKLKKVVLWLMCFTYFLLNHSLIWAILPGYTWFEPMQRIKNNFEAKKGFKQGDEDWCTAYSLLTILCDVMAKNTENQKYELDDSIISAERIVKSAFDTGSISSLDPLLYDGDENEPEKKKKTREDAIKQDEEIAKYIFDRCLLKESNVPSILSNKTSSSNIVKSETNLTNSKDDKYIVSNIEKFENKITLLGNLLQFLSPLDKETLWSGSSQIFKNSVTPLFFQYKDEEIYNLEPIFNHWIDKLVKNHNENKDNTPIKIEGEKRKMQLTYILEDNKNHEDTFKDIYDEINNNNRMVWLDLVSVRANKELIEPDAHICVAYQAVGGEKRKIICYNPWSYRFEIEPNCNTFHIKGKKKEEEQDKNKQWKINSYIKFKY